MKTLKVQVADKYDKTPPIDLQDDYEWENGKYLPNEMPEHGSPVLDSKPAHHDLLEEHDIINQKDPIEPEDEDPSNIVDELTDQFRDTDDPFGVWGSIKLMSSLAGLQKKRAELIDKVSYKTDDLQALWDDISMSKAAERLKLMPKANKLEKICNKMYKEIEDLDKEIIKLGGQ